MIHSHPPFHPPIASQNPNPPWLLIIRIPHPVKAGLLGLNISNYFKYIWWLCASSVVVLAVLKTE